jgi:hypothetical protein
MHNVAVLRRNSPCPEKRLGILCKCTCQFNGLAGKLYSLLNVWGRETQSLGPRVFDEHQCAAISQWWHGIDTSTHMFLKRYKQVINS